MVHLSIICQYKDATNNWKFHTNCWGARRDEGLSTCRYEVSVFLAFISCGTCGQIYLIITTFTLYDCSYLSVNSTVSGKSLHGDAFKYHSKFLVGVLKCLRTALRRSNFPGEAQMLTICEQQPHLYFLGNIFHLRTMCVIYVCACTFTYWTISHGIIAKVALPSIEPLLQDAQQASKLI